MLFLLVAGVSGAWAQSSGDTYQKYVYKGVTAATAVSGSNSQAYYLYNVGTGTFFFIGSTWGTKGSLLYDDLGLSLSVHSTRVRTTSYSDLRTYYYFSPKNLNGNLGMVQITDASNTPGVYADRGKYSGNTDDDRKFRYNYLWDLEPVADAPTGVTQYYLRNLGCSGDATYDGYYSNHTSAAAKFIYLYGSNQNLGEVQCSGSKVVNSSFYKWQIVPESELIADFMNETSATAYGGLNASLSFLIQNQGFYCTNTGGWKKTSGLSFIDKDPNNTLGEQASVVGTADASGQMNFGKYYHANLSGTGWLFQTISAPKAGLYHIYCQGFDNTGEGAVFYAVSGEATLATIASIVNNDFTSSENSRTNLKKTTLTRTTPVTLADYKTYNSSTRQWELNPNNTLTVRNLAAGVAFYNNEYTNDLYVYVPEDNGKITIAIQKKNSSSYTAVDDFHALYLGAYSFMIDEEDTRAKATGADGKITEWYEIDGEQQNASVLEEAKHENLKNISVMFKRSMTVGQWNTLVLPFDMSATAFKRAFGETTKLAECTGLDQTNPNVITFKQDDISSDAGVLIRKGKFYLIDPGNGPSELDHDITFIDTEGTGRHIPAGTKFFTLGRQDFSGTSTDSRDWADEAKTKFVDPTSEQLFTAPNHNSIQLKGTYFRLDNFDGDDQRLYSDSPENQKYVFGHKGDTYAMWRLGTTRRAIKGTRWWIEDVYSGSGAKDVMLFSINGVVDGDVALAIDKVEGFTPVVRKDNKVYNLNGQVVNTSLESLPSGIYIMNGKKYVVK